MTLHNDREDEVTGRVEYLLGPDAEAQAHDENRQRQESIAEWKARKEEITMFIKELIHKGARVNWRRDADRMRAAGNRSSVGAMRVKASGALPEKPKMKSFAGTVSKHTAMSMEEAREAFAGQKQMGKSASSRSLHLYPAYHEHQHHSTTRSAVSQPKARRKLVVSETLEEVVLPPPVPFLGTTEAERDSSGWSMAESDDGALLFSTDEPSMSEYERIKAYIVYIFAQVHRLNHLFSL